MKREKTKKMVFLATMIAVFTGWGFVDPSWAQGTPQEDLQILLRQATTEKKQLIAANMELTESEAKGFWPVFDSYQKELTEINLRIVKLLEGYATDLQANTLTDEKAQKLIDEFVLIEQAEGGLQAAYAPKLGKVLPPKKVARYLQIENKIRALVKYNLAKVPLVVP